MESSPASTSGRGYPYSVDSSPRSRGGDSWRIMCSYGGRILPRPTDKSLCYLGGQTRMVVIDRRATLADLSAKLSRDLLGGAAPFTLKYQLPNEDLDSLISVAADEDLENMIDELDRIAAAPASSGNGSGSRRSAGLRLFLFPAKLDSTPSSAIGSLIDESTSGTLFVDSLNCAISGMGVEEIPRGSTDSASINCLLGLDDGSSIHMPGGQSEPERRILLHPDSSSRLGRHGQKVQSVPGSPMLDKASSFGSTSSTPLSNLPPIPVPTIDRTTEHQDDQFSHMNRSPDYASKQRVDEGFKDADHAAHPHHPPPLPFPIVSASSPNISPTENPNRDTSDGDKSDRGGLRKPSQRLITPQNDNNIPCDPVSRAMNSNPANTSYFMSSPPVTELPAYIMPRTHSEQLQRQQPRLHFQQQQPQIMPANTHYIHQTASGAVLSRPSNYPIAGHPMHQTPQVRSLDPQVPVFYMPVHDTTPYNSAAVPPNVADARTLHSLGKPSAPIQAVPTKSAVPISAYITPVHVAANQSHPYAGTGYHVIQHPHLSQSPSTMVNYSYEMPAATGHPQMVYSQAASQPALPRQYQPARSAAVTGEQLPKI